jgi:hypothetical protein
MVLQHWDSALDTETQAFGLSFAKSGRQQQANSIVDTLVYDSSLRFL